MGRDLDEERFSVFLFSQSFPEILGFSYIGKSRKTTKFRENTGGKNGKQSSLRSRP